MELECLINGYLRRTNLYKPLLFVPTDIVDLIVQYFTFEYLDSCSYLLIIEAHSRNSSEMIQLMNSSTLDINKSININYVCRFAKSKQWKYINVGQCVGNKTKLPFQIQCKFKKSANYSHVFNEQQLISNNWSFITHIGGGIHNDDDEDNELLWKYKTNESHLTVIHPNDLQNIYNFELPLFPQKVINPSIIYNKYNETLYAMNGRSNNWNDLNGKTIYSLDFNSKPSVSNKAWKWNKLCHSLQCMRFDTSLCLIDNNIFIIGGSRGTFCLNYVELFNINSMKSIWIQNMNKKRMNAANVYHDKFYKIIVASDNNLEWYDINVDKWIMIESCPNYNYWHKQMNIRPNIWISSFNPNIIFVSGRMNATNNRIGIGTEMLDLRQTNCKWKIISLYDIDDSLQYDKDFGSAFHLSIHKNTEN